MEKRIVGGSEAHLDQYPYNVQFYNLGGLCGGSILTKKIVLTAAHCFDSNKNLADMKIFSKPRYLFDLHANSHDIWDFRIHEDYGMESVFDNDIAVIIIHNEFVFGKQVRNIKIINNQHWEKENETFTVTGWGETKYGDGIDKTVFRQVQLRYISKEMCMKMNQITLDTEMFCLYGDGKRDSCRGDSGGGVLWKGQLVGIVSHGKGCGGLPGTRDVLNEVEGRIIGGRPIPIEISPFSVLFFNFKSLCSGVIINSFVILTAAHCFNSNTNKHHMRVEINCRYLFDINAETFRVADFIIHEDFNKVIPFEADLALIMVTAKMLLDRRKQKALLMKNDDWMNEKANVSASGWGWTKYGGGVSELGLMRTYLGYVSRRRCESLHSLRLTEDMFCLYGNGVRDTCLGDSGGGVTVNGTVVGIVSHGDGCAKKGKPSVYISVAYHRKWIEKKNLELLRKNCFKTL
ncbi:Transmembrane protease serine 11E [Danaus plexippus plexippus]|uniref:Transmembrane protease serine 11E n=1 Tax=Danaus plexippus plexippus TaxID=278856 RepID=A0A212F7S3_DANPL|nr:Transmembrane protease serine 11E [Danaus plexippus plexippus]